MVTPCGLGSRFFDRARVHFMVSSGEVMVLLLRDSLLLVTEPGCTLWSLQAGWAPFVFYRRPFREDLRSVNFVTLLDCCDEVPSTSKRVFALTVPGCT